MSKNNVRIAIRDSTDSHNVAFFDNQAGIKYKSANLQRFLAGSASILTIKYNSKDIDTIRSGCKLAFRYKNRDYWLNVMSFEKKGFEVELTAYSLGLELNNETRGEHKPANAMSIAEYVAYYDPEHALTIGVNEVSDKRIKLEWTGTGTILARLFSVANSFGAELDFSVELNDDYSLKRQVLNIYKKGNLGTNKVSQPVRVGKELKVINYSDNIKELRTAVRATGKDGLTIDGLDKKIYDNNKELLYYSSGMTVYAPQSRDRFPSVGKVSNDNWIVEDLGETQYETKEALWGYMYGEIQKKSLPEITYEVEGAIEAGIGDTQTLIDDIHFEPALYVQARVSELEDDILTGKVTKSTFINFERKYSQIADILLKQVEALAEDAAPYIIRLSTNNGYIFKNGEGSSTITARLEKYSKDIAATWEWVVDNKVVGTGDKLTVKAEQIKNTMAVTVIAYVNGNEVVRDYMTFSNSDDGVGVESIDRYFTSSDQSDGVTIEGAEWSDKPPAPTEDGKYLWAYDEITYTNGTVTTTKPSAVGANFDVDAFRAEIAEDLKDVPNREEFENKISEELANSKAEIETQIETAKTQAESNAKEYADTINQETTKVAELANAAAGEIKADLVNVKNNLTATRLVANNAQASVDKAKQDLTKVTSDLNTAKQDLTKVTSDLNTAKQDLANSVTAVNTKVDSTKAELTQAKQDLTSHAQQLQTQANAQTELTKRVTTVETTANGTKTTVNELTKTVAQNGKDITSVTNRTKTVEDDLANTKTTLTQVQTTANSTSQKTATLETGLNGLNAKFETLKVGSRNYFKNSKSRKYYIDNTKTQDVRTYIDDEFWKNDTRFTKDYVRMSFDIAFNPALPSDFTTDVHFSASPWYNCGGITFKGGTTALQHFDLKFNLSGAGNSYKTDNVFIRLHNTLPLNTAVSLKNFNLYLSAVVEDYTQNEADIESKVAEYKQTADQNYASLQSNLQTLDGTVKQNKSEFDQTASQLKTTISAVEGKIPTDVSTRNLILKSNDFANPHKQNGANTTVTSTDEYFVVKNAGYTANVWGGMSWNMSISEMKAGEQFSILMPVYIDSSVPMGSSLAFIIKNHTLNSAAYSYDIPTNKKDQWFNVAITFKAYKDVVFDAYPFYICLVKNGLVRIKPPMLVRGSLIPSDYQPAFEDTESDINTLSSQIKQTADGMTLLATKTELNTAKSDLQSGISTATSKADNAQATANSNAQTISTHTTQISALNTGLNAKVSQSDFNTLSGRVTTAENNIIAKANELSSKITSVEGKIPTELGVKNLIKQSTAQKGLRLSIGAQLYQDQAHSLSDWIKIEPNTTYTLTTYEDVDEGSMYYSLAWYSTNNADYSGWISRPTGALNAADLKGGKQYTSPANAAYAKVSYPTKYSKVKLERGKVSTDYTPAPEDTVDQISSLSSQIKQTADGITLLATKTELNSAKNELQSGINTATNKANSAQNTANSAQNTANNNAQTISTHTTQISALNTGLNAKVSQSDFNTLSGRVTTAENNIIAKANELSSKITSVEGKIPTSVGGRNYIKDSEYRKVSIYVNDNQSQDEAFNISSAFWQNSNVYAKKIKLSFYYQPSVAYGTERRFQVYFRTSPWPWIGEVRYPANTTRLIKYTIAMANSLPANFTAKQIFIRFEGSLDKGRYHNIGKVMLEVSDVFSDWQPAPEDAISQISTLSSELKQTQDGITLLATKTELNSAKNELQSGINTATNKANSAQNTANSAQNTANNNAQTISTHTTQISALNTGLNAKVSQSDFNTLSGRVTTAENNIIAKANELSSKITSVEGKIPTELGVKNLIKQSTAQKGLRLSIGAQLYQDQAHSLSDWIKIEPNTTYTLTTYEDVDEGSMYYSLAWYSTNNADYSGWISRPTGALNAADLKGGKQYTSPANAAYAKVSYPTKYSKVKLERGKVSTDYTPAPEDYDSKLASVQSEIKQTTDSITASVQSLDNSTVKSSSLTINTNGVVIKAGKSPSDFANAIGSYFAVNQNAINLFSDKINVKGSMIVSGAITSDKIASKQINTAHLNGKIITADVISSNAVTADAIKAGAVTTNKMSANSINGDRITAGTLDAAKIKAGSITASQIASGTITSAQIKAGTISAANIAAGAITANMITGGQLNSTNGATSFDLNAGTLTFNNNYGYIQRVAGDKIFEIQTWLGADSNSRDYLTSAFAIRKSDNSRLSGIQFQLYNTMGDKPTSFANIWADSFHLGSSKGGFLFIVDSKNNAKPSWGDIPIAHINGGLIVKDIAIGGHFKSLLSVVDELCKKTGITW